MTIFLSPEASQQLAILLNYLEEEWSSVTRRKFQKKLDQKLNVIKIMPFAFPESKIYKQSRKCVITSQTSVFYRINIRACWEFCF